MMDATRMCFGFAFLIRSMRGTHQSSVLSEMSSQFHDEWRAAPARFSIDRWEESGVARMNLVFGPLTLTTGCSPIVFVTTPPQPASNARMMLLSDSVGGADDRRNGFSNEIPVNVDDKSAMESPFWETLIIDFPAMRRIALAVLLICSPLLAQEPKPAPEKPKPAPPPQVTPIEPQKPKERPLTALPYTPSL